jgi:hypothetical protein
MAISLKAFIVQHWRRYSHASAPAHHSVKSLRAGSIAFWRLARGTGKLERFIIFGSYITAKPEPNDVDILLVMRDDLQEQDYDPDTFPMFDHLRAQRELGVSLFVIRPGFIIGEEVDQFIAHWQVKRDLSRRGIVEVIPEVEG